MGHLPANSAAFVVIIILVCIATNVQTYAQPRLPDGGNDPVKIIVLPASAASHWYQFLPVIKELSRRGHSMQVHHVTHRNGRSFLAH